MLTVVPEPDGGDESRREPRPAVIDELVREGARRMLAEALQAEVDDYIARHAGEHHCGQGERLDETASFHGILP